MINRYVLLLLSFVLPGVQAEPILNIQSESGDCFSVQRIANGELWASFFMTDQLSVGFADYEPILMQLDQHKPVKLVQAFRSCAAPAAPEPTVSFVFEQSANNQSWLFDGVKAPKSDALKLLGWDEQRYDTIKADRREVVVDIPLERDALGRALQQQLKQAKQLTFRYVTAEGEVRKAVFDLQQRH
jgi:hypothetical protein